MSDWSQPNSEPESRLANGEFYAKRDKVFRAPIKTKTDSGTRISVGFPVCHVSDYVDPANLVECLNASREVDGLKARIQDLTDALQIAQELFAIVVNPQDHPNTSVQHLWAQCKEIECKIRDLLQPKDGAK
jgi:hypothetical protein